MALRCDSGDRVGVQRAAALRLLVVLAILVGSGLLAASALATARSEKSLGTLNHRVFVAINKFRAAHHLSVLRESSALDRSARQHSLEMGRVGYFAHDSANGRSFWKRIERYYPQGNHSYWSTGENLLWSSPTVSGPRALSMWIASPEHLRNLLTPQWRQLGVSAVRVVHAAGVFKGLDVVIITTDFGARR